MADYGKVKPHEWDGKRFELLAMPDDPDPLPGGSKGTIEWVCVFAPNVLFLNVRWDDGIGRSLNLSVPPDEIRILGEGDD